MAAYQEVEREASRNFCKLEEGILICGHAQDFLKSFRHFQGWKLSRFLISWSSRGSKGHLWLWSIFWVFEKVIRNFAELYKISQSFDRSPTPRLLKILKIFWKEDSKTFSSYFHVFFSFHQTGIKLIPWEKKVRALNQSVYLHKVYTADKGTISIFFFFKL